MRASNQSRIFVSYSRSGNGLKWKAALLEVFKVFAHNYLLDFWEDGRIRIGSYWNDDICDAIQSCRFAVLLLTQEALESRYILETEFPLFRQQQKRVALKIVPVVCEKCNWKEQAWLAATQSPNWTDPLSEMPQSSQRIVLRKVATDIAEEFGRVALQELDGNKALQSATVYLEKFPLTHGPGLREEKLIGREQELALLDLAFAQPQIAIVSLVAWGGVGKTMLVQHWLQRIQRQSWFGTRRIYAWNFYSQGTKEDRQASEDTFLTHALEWFGVRFELTLSPWEKGRLLADAVARERTLLVLDGIEPLQDPPGPMGGQLRAPGVQGLLKHLARKSSSSSQPSSLNQSFVLVTTREPLTDLAEFQRHEGSPWGSVLRLDLGNLADEAGAALLHHVGTNRAGAADIEPNDDELLFASREVDGHALTLTLLGRFLARAHGGDIRRRDLVNFTEADLHEQGGTTFKMLATFENWFAKSGEFGTRQLAVLRILGLFDRPADSDCIGELRKLPAIDGLTDSLFITTISPHFGLAIVRQITEADWKTATSFLADFALLVFQTDGPHTERMLDCHPLIREHFASQLQKENPQAWVTGNLRLYKFLTETTPDQPDPTFEDLLPLYRALRYGCAGGLYREAFMDVFWKRIRRRCEHHSDYTFYAFSEHLTHLACFFDAPWECPNEELPEDIQGWLLNQAALCLRALGRTTDAVFCMRQRLALTVDIPRQDSAALNNAAISVGNLSQLELSVGEVVVAINDGQRAVKLADDARNSWEAMARRAILADALFQNGQQRQAAITFQQAEEIQAREQPDYPILYSQRGYKFNELLLHEVECVIWRKSVGILMSEVEQNQAPDDLFIEMISAVQGRLRVTLPWAIHEQSAQAIGLDYLVAAKTVFFGAMLRAQELAVESEQFDAAREHLWTAIEALQASGEQEFIARGLLLGSWWRVFATDITAARADLDEAWDIAERGPMRLHLADIHLYRARLFFREKEYPWRVGRNLNGKLVTNRTAADDLAAAEKLIKECGYHRRDEELTDAKRAILGKQ